MSEIAKVYVTTYVCSKGILLEECEIDSSRMRATPVGNRWNPHRKGEWFRTFEEAVSDANERRQKKLVSLRKTFDRLMAREWKDPSK